jgi:hypothetical protein
MNTGKKIKCLTLHLSQEKTGRVKIISSTPGKAQYQQSPHNPQPNPLLTPPPRPHLPKHKPPPPPPSSAQES